MQPIPTMWRKSSHSGPTNCVEVADLPAGTAVRDSQNPTHGHLDFPAAEWSAFIHGVRKREL